MIFICATCKTNFSIVFLQLKCQLFFFKLTTNQKFDIGIMSVILLNMLTMAIEHYGMSTEFTDGLGYINTVFIAIFTLECVMKLLGLRWYYFKQPWNVFDFVVVVVSILGRYMCCTMLYKYCLTVWSLDHSPLQTVS